MPPAATALDIATTLVCGFEGFRAAPYLDTAGVPTIGYGSTRWRDGDPVSMANGAITEADARALMMAELTPICATVAKCGPGNATPSEIGACGSFAYNEGIRAFLGSVLFSNWLYDHQYPTEAAQHFLDWIYDHDPDTHQLVEVPGLKNRRLKEQAVFLGAAP